MKKLQGLPENKKPLKQETSEETKQTSQADSDMTQMLGLSGRGFKITIINMLRTLQKCRPYARQMGKVSRGETLRIRRKGWRSKHQNRKEEWFHGLLSRLDTAEERIRELEDRVIISFQTGKQREE